jgi:hypothetical protein
MDTPNTVNYMLAGYLVFSATFFGYLVSLYLRWQKLQEEQDSLQEVDSQE